MSRINHFICPNCGHDFFETSAYATCDACGFHFYASHSRTCNKPQGLGGTAFTNHGQLGFAPPVCNTHGIQMHLSFYLRPGSPLGSGYVCRQCISEREATGGFKEPQ